MKNFKDRDRQRRPAERQPKKEIADHGTFVVEGLSALTEYVRFRPDVIRSVTAKREYLDRATDLVKALGLVPNLARGSSVAGDTADAVDPNREAPIWAEVALESIDESELLTRVKDRTENVIIALDHITDPRNLGAIARSAAFFGVREVVVPERRQVLLTRASVATAQGAFALVDLVTIVNLSRTLDQLKEAGYWVIGADMAGDPLKQVAAKFEKVVIVMGAEDKGISREVQKRCDVMASIAGHPERLESLNVSVATGIFLHEFWGARLSRSPR